MKPEVRRAILASNPNATPQDIDEYERLLSARSSRDPERMRDALFRAEADRGTERLRAVHAKLFPGARPER